VIDLRADVEISYRSHSNIEPVVAMYNRKYTITVNLTHLNITSIDLYQFQRFNHLKAIKLSNNHIGELDISPLFYCRNQIILEIDQEVLVYSGVELHDHPNRPKGKLGKSLLIDWRSEHLGEMLDQLDSLSLLEQTRFFRKTEQHFLAEESLECAILKAKDDHEQLMELVNNLREVPELEQRDRILNLAVLSAEFSFMTLLKLGRRLLESGHADQAHLAFARALRTDNPNYLDWLELGHQMYSLQDPESCRSACMKAIWNFEGETEDDVLNFGKQIEKLGCSDLGRMVYEEYGFVQQIETPRKPERSLKRLERLGIDVPFQIYTLGPLPEPDEKPTRMELPIVGHCVFCSGDLVKGGRFAFCLNCGKMEDTDVGEYKERKRRLRRDLRKPRT